MRSRAEARRLGVPPRIFARMLFDVALEDVVGAVPIAGDACDVAFRANRRNVRLLRDDFDGPLWKFGMDSDFTSIGSGIRVWQKS